jgi:hypothetical protein
VSVQPTASPVLEKWQMLTYLICLVLTDYAANGRKQGRTGNAYFCSRISLHNDMMRSTSTHTKLSLITTMNKILKDLENSSNFCYFDRYFHHKNLLRSASTRCKRSKLSS